jgi:MFS family permease
MTEPADQEARVSKSGYHWYVLAVLCLLALCSNIDRQLPAVLATPLQERFQFTDTQYGLLQGLAFALTYSLFAVPFGLLVDRTNRRNIIAFGVLVWSLLTIAPAFATSYNQLVVSRLGVGIGEAILAPAAYSLIADYFEPRQRGRAAGIFYGAVAVGAGSSMIFGGYVLRALPHEGLVIAGLSFVPWQLVFMAAGAAGLLVTALALTIREPLRGEVHPGTVPSLPRTFRYVWMHRAILGRVMLVSAFMAMAGYGTSAWLTVYFERRFAIPAIQSAPAIGVMFIVTSIIGPMFGGWLSDKWAGQGNKTARYRVLLLASVIFIPASFWALMPSYATCMSLCYLMLIGISLLQAAIPLVLQEAVPGDMHGQIVALQYLVLGLVGIGLGPAAVPLIGDILFGPGKMLNWSLTIFAASLGVIGLWLTWSLVRIVGRRSVGDAVVA